MILTDQQASEMLEAAKPLMKWVSNNCHPHCTAMVDAVRVELVEGIAIRTTVQYPDDREGNEGGGK